MDPADKKNSLNILREATISSFMLYMQDDPGGEEVKEAASADPGMDSTEYILGKDWRDLIPVIKVFIVITTKYKKEIYIFYLRNIK